MYSGNNRIFSASDGENRNCRRSLARDLKSRLLHFLSSFSFNSCISFIDKLVSYLYQEKGADYLLFKGGTALRIVWQSPRFSEDLDFTGIKIGVTEIESLMEATLDKVEKEGVVTDIMESKKTSGGYLAIFVFKTQEYNSEIRMEVSLRSAKQNKGAASLIQSDYGSSSLFKIWR